MERRSFLKKTLAGAGTVTFAAGTMAGGISNIAAARNRNTYLAKNNFKHKYAPHFGMFKNHVGDDPIEELKFMADNGFLALEDNGMMQRPVDQQEKIGNQLNKLGMTMGVFVIDGGDNWKTSLTTGKQEFQDNFLNTCRKAVEVSKRVNAKWMTVVPGYFERNLPMGIQTGNVIESLRKGAAILEPHGLIMVLEPLSDNADLFLRFSDQAYGICKSVNSPACKVLYDIYHMQRNEGNLISHIENAWDEIAYFQVGDNPGRKEPGTGEINFKSIFQHIYKKGYRGVVGMEHGIFNPGKEGEIALINAYLSADDFRV